jgi:predicted nucleic acid-binding protein
VPGIVLDTNVVSEPKRAVPDPHVVAWYALSPQWRSATIS